MNGSLTVSLASLPKEQRHAFLASLTAEEWYELEVDSRALIRSDLTNWCIEALAWQELVPARHHRFLIRELSAVASGSVGKLMILMPPGSAKTTYASYLFPSWLMARGNIKILAATHSIDRGVYVSRQVQRYARENSDVLGYDLVSTAVEQWSTTNRCEYLAAGVGKGIAGFRADLGLIDDPVAKRQDADSDTNQETIWDWYWSDFYPRLRPGASQVLIMTRWAEGDLGGRLEEAEGKDWRIVRLPAIAEADDPLGRQPGEFLWNDDEYNFGAKLRADFVSYNNAGRSRDWAALYQQRPVPESGNYFRREWFRSVPTLPPRDSLRVFGASDYAVTENGGDFTAHVVVGIDADDRLYVLDVWRHQTASDAWVEAFCDLVIRWKPMGWAEELGQIRAGIGPWLDRRSRERKAFVAREAFPTRGDKAVRAQSIRGRAALNGLYIPADALWRADLETELMSFPAGKHDDQVDALGLVGQLIDIMFPPGKPAAPPKPRDSWAYAFNRGDEESDGWKTA